MPKRTDVVLLTYFMSGVRVQIGGTGTRSITSASGRATDLCMPKQPIESSGIFFRILKAWNEELGINMLEIESQPPRNKITQRDL